MKVAGRTLLLVGAGCSTFVAALHMAILIVGPAWYRYFGAPSLAARIEAGAALVPVLLTVGVAAVFVIWACYALSGAGAIRRLPLLRAGLYTIAVIYLLRGAQVVAEVVALMRGAIPPRFAVFSAFSAVAGLIYLLGTIRMGAASGTPQVHAA